MRKRVLALAGCVCLALGGCHYQQPVEPTPTPSAAPSADPAIRQVFTLPVDPVGEWDPYGGGKSGNMTLLPLICESLYALDNAFAPQPVLAQSASASEDGLAWTVTLRSGVRFSDGESLSAEAVAQAVNAARGEKSAYAKRLSGVRKVAAQEDGTVQFQLSAPNSGFLSLLDFPIARVTETGVVGTGPYVRQEGCLVANADWWQEKALPLAEIPLQEAGDADTLVASFNAGAVSVAAADPTGADTLGYSGSCQSWEYPTSTMVYLGFRCSKGPCRDGAFRRAVAQALDRDSLTHQALAGHGVAAALPAPPSSARYDQTAAVQLTYDVTAAGAALEEQGYKLAQDGVRYRGRDPLALTLLVSADNASLEAMANAAAEDLGALGVQVSVRALPWEDYKKALSQGDFDLYLAQSRMTGDLDPGPYFTAGSGVCYGGFSSKALTEALLGARKSGDWGEFYAQWVQDVPVAPICFKSAGLLTRWGQVQGASPTQGNLFYGFENWKIT